MNSKSKIQSTIYDCILMFMFVFGFRVYSVVDSTILVGIILTTSLLINPKMRNTFINGISKITFVKTIIIILSIIAWGLMSSLLGGDRNLNYIFTVVHLLIVIIIGYELYAYYKSKNRQNQIINYIIVAFLIQTILQWFFLFNPNISALFNPLRSQSMLNKSANYNQYRGLAIASSGFFALSSSYAIAIVLYVTNYNTLFKNKLLRALFFIVLISGTIFAGRTGYIGLPFALIYLIMSNIKQKNFLLNLIKIIASTVIILLSFMTIMKTDIKNDAINNAFNYSFGIFRRAINGEGVASTSTDALIDMYDRDFTARTLLIGDGKYDIEEDGQRYYYNKVDIGYYRKIFYFGIIGTILSILLELTILGKNSPRKTVLIILLLILEMKGEVIGINIMINSILLLSSWENK